MLSLAGNLDISDAAIADWAIGFISSGKCESVRFEGYDYFWLSYDKCLTDLPLLRITSRDSIRKRIPKLVAAKILIACPNNVSLNRSYFRLGEAVEAMLFYRPAENNPNPGKIFPPTLGNSSHLPCENFPRYTSISDIGIKDNKDGAKAPDSPSLFSPLVILRNIAPEKP